MSLKIVHISDVHIRNLKYHDEYRRVFDDLYGHINDIKPDLVINTGDTAHTKTQISPEFVQVASDHMRAVAEQAPYHLILGNHDLNLMNPDRQDALTPIVESINNPLINLHKKSGLGFTFEKDGIPYNFWVFSLADRERYPTPDAWRKLQDQVNIGLFHGSVATCVTDLNWRMTHVEHDLSIFDGLDYALLGDIHKQQFFKDGRIAYPGSLIQQNFGEEIEKGFLLWELDGKDRWKSTPIHLHGSRKFYTLKLQDDLSIPPVDYDEGSRIRISPPKQITLSQQKEIEKNVRKQFKPYDVITLSATDIGVQKVAGQGSVAMENLRQVQVQEKLIREFLAERKLPDVVLQKVLDLNRKYQIHIEQEDDTPRNIKWSIDKIIWSNFFNYGEENFVDFAKIPGLTGIFAPNASGKSAFIDILLETCFDATTKGVNKNIYLVNDNKENASAVAEISVNDQRYLIERNIERIKYGQKKFDETKEWGKTSVTFSMLDELGDREPLTGVSRPETERTIRQRLGTYDDFLLTSLSAQWNPLDIISCKETKRKEIFYKFFDLDIFAQKQHLGKEESREYFDRLKRLEDDGLDKIIVSFRNKTFEQQDRLEDRKYDLEIVQDQHDEVDKDIDQLNAEKPKVKEASNQDWTAKLDKINFDMNVQHQKNNELQMKLSHADSELTKILKLEQKFDLQAYETHEETLKGLNAANDALQRKLVSYTVQVRTLDEVPCGDQFPGCKFLVNAFEAKKIVPTIQANVLVVKKSIEELTPLVQKLHEYRKFVSEKELMTSNRDNIKLQVENVKLKIDSIRATRHTCLEEKAVWERAEADIKKAEKIENIVRKLGFQRERLAKDVRGIRDDLDEINRELGSSEGILEKLTSQLTELQDLRDTCQAFEHFEDAMGKDGIAYEILIQKLPMLNEEINKILSNVADFGIFVEHDPEEQSIRFLMQYGQYKSRLLELASGAEKFLGSIAIRAGLLSMSNLPKTNMFIVDEGFGKLDPKNLESVQRMFDYLRTVFDHIIIVSHLDSMKDIVDNIIEITADQEGYAHMIVGED